MVIFLEALVSLWNHIKGTSRPAAEGPSTPPSAQAAIPPPPVEPASRQSAEGSYIAQADRGGTARVEVTHLHQAPAPLPPAPLFTIPDPPSGFTGRVDELNTLLAAFVPPPGSNEAPAQSSGVLISGGAGAGKTALARLLARQVAERYPDARLELDLRGSPRPDEQPLSPAEAMARLLAPFYPGQPLPADERELRSLYIHTFRSRPVLLLLDNARDAAQVRPLLPPAHSAAILTSRTHIPLSEAGLQPLHLRVLPLSDSLVLLRKISARLVEATDQIVSDLAELCGHLPLALRIAASLLESRPDWIAQDLLDRLGNERNRLSALHLPGDPDLDVTTALELSYCNLTEPLQVRFRALGVFPASFDTFAVAKVWEDAGELSGAAGDDLGALLNLSLLEYHSETREYALHDLVRLYAQERLLEYPEEAYLSMERHADWSLTVGSRADEQYNLGGENIIPALAIFDAAWPHLRVAWERMSGSSAGWPDADQSEQWLNLFPDRLLHLLDLRLAPSQRIPFLERALESARHVQDKKYEGYHLGNLGIAHNNLGEARRAIEYFERALAISRQTGDSRSEGAALGNLGLAYDRLGDARRAIEYHEHALAISRQTGDRRGEGNALLGLGNAYHSLGEVRRAIEYHEQALAIHRQTSDRHGEGQDLGNLGLAYADLGETRRAIEFHEQSLSIHRELGDRRGEGHALGNLGNAYAALGETRRAIEYHEQALAIHRETGDRRGEGNALANMGWAYEQLGDLSQTQTCWQQALEIYEAIEDPNAVRVRQWLAKLDSG